MFLEHIPVVQDTGCIGHIGYRIVSFHRNQLQCLINGYIGRCNVFESLIVGHIRQDLCIHIVGIVDVAADTDNIRIILTDKPGSQNSRGIVGRVDGQMNVVMRLIKGFFNLFKIVGCFRLILHDLDLCHAFFCGAATTRKRYSAQDNTSGI